MRRPLQILAASALVVAASCSPVTRDRVMRFFFEIPENPAPAATEPGAAASMPAAETPAAESRTDRTRRQWVSRASFTSTHPPFVQRQCRACHDPEHPSALRAEARTVCSECHAVLFESRPFLHGPFASGACATCHQPHISALPRLLKESEPELCLDCHEATQTHKCSGQLPGVATRACTPCHDPHAEQQQYMLKPRDQWQHLLGGPATGTHGDGRR